jgi:hypothetical protein
MGNANTIQQICQYICILKKKDIQVFISISSFDLLFRWRYIQSEQNHSQWVGTKSVCYHVTGRDSHTSILWSGKCIFWVVLKSADMVILKHKGKFNFSNSNKIVFKLKLSVAKQYTWRHDNYWQL